MVKIGSQANVDAAVTEVQSTDAASPDWRSELPRLEGRRITLREPRAADAAALYALLSTDDVSRFISPPPATVEGFERYISWCQRQRTAGQYVCFAIVRRGEDTPIGLVHVRALGPGFGTADWGFALGSEFWGSGIFAEAAELVLDFAFDVLGGHRKSRIYGRLDCPSARRAIARGGYVAHRVFFADEPAAIAAGYRPCAVCLPGAYAAWLTRGPAALLRLDGRDGGLRNGNVADLTLLTPDLRVAATIVNGRVVHADETRQPWLVAEPSFVVGRTP